MNRQRRTVLIYGARSYLGGEVARFGRAMGHRMVAVVNGSIPERDQPWMHGVHWTTDFDALIADWPQGPPAAIVYCDTALWDGGRGRFDRLLVQRPKRLFEAAQTLRPPPRFVLRSTVDQPFLSSKYTAACRRAEQLLADSSLDSVILRLPLLYGPDRPDSVAAMMVSEAVRRAARRPDLAPMRVERAALAALRAALEPDLSGILEPAQIARVGDVMIPQ